MGTNFKYKIKSIEVDCGLYYETHIKVKYRKSSLKFYSGLYCLDTTYFDYNQEFYRIYPSLYPLDRCYRFKKEWIEMQMYHIYIQSLVEPDKDYLEISKNTIINDIELLNGEDSFIYNLGLYISIKFRFLIGDKYKDVKKSIYNDFMLYHRLLDCLIDYQIEYETILVKGNYDLELLYLKIRNYKTSYFELNLEKEFKTFVDWTNRNGNFLFDKKDYELIRDNKI